jgi:putative nucleotide binding protein
VHDRASVIRKHKRFINYSDLNANEQVLLASVLEKYIESNPEPFLTVINKAPPLSLNKHSLELFPGVGKKTMQNLIKEIHNKPFDSLEDLRARGSLTAATIAERIIEELSSAEEKHFLLVKWKIRQRSMKKTTSFTKQTVSKNDPFRRAGGYPR